MASSGGELAGLVPEKGEPIPPGKPMSTEQQLLDKGGQMMQSLNPVNQIKQHVCTFALYSQDLTRQIETHHYLTRLNQDFIQCAVYDTDDSHGRLIGLYRRREESKKERESEEELAIAKSILSPHRRRRPAVATAVAVAPAPTVVKPFAPAPAIYSYYMVVVVAVAVGMGMWITRQHLSDILFWEFL